MVIAYENSQFKQALNKAQIKLIDGIGIVIAAFLLNTQVGDRFPGVELMQELIILASKRRLRVLLIGGKPNLALRLAQCYQRIYPEAKFVGIEGIKNIQNPTKIEENEIFSIITDFKPHLVFVAFGSPEQELWIERHRDQFDRYLLMGVGGAFDFLSGAVPRAPRLVQAIGLEWLYRLIRQPWRWKRQLRLIKFCYLVLKQKFQR